MEALKKIQSTLPAGVELVAVSKFHPVERLLRVYDAGQRVFGESRVQELMQKIPLMPADVRWHFIGHLQTNKVKQVVGAVSLIESIDSLRLLELVDRVAAEKGIIQRVLMQVHVAAEETKTGFLPEELLDYFGSRGYHSLKATHLCGIMGMATNTDDETRIAADFKAIADVHRRIKELCGTDLAGFDTISMGMSDDYPLAIAEGSTMVRVGTAIFGPREY